MFDCVFTGGFVIDGAGNKGFFADVGVAGEKVEAVGDLSEAECRKKVDCTGFVVSPGFIDPHAHVDFQVLLFPLMGNLIQQGITSVMSGNCSLSALPSSQACRTHLGALGPLSQLDDVPYEWTTLDGYYDALERAGIAINIGQLVGHGPLRTVLMGFTENRIADKKDLQDMGEVLERQLDEGAFGLSSGRSYVPSRYADVHEMVELSKICSARGAVHAQHVKQLSSWEGIDEFLATAEQSGCRMQMAHFCPQTPDEMEKGHKMFEEAAQRGVDVTYTSITYAFYSLRTDSLARGLGATLGMHPTLNPEGDITPEEAYRRFCSALDDREMVEEFKRILVNIEQHSFIDYFDMAWAGEGTMVLDAGFGSPPGRTIKEISESLGKDRIDTTWDLVFGDGPLYVFSTICLPDEFIGPLCAHPQGVPMTDATYRWTDLYDRDADPWAVSFGAFPRYFRLMREMEVSLEQAVYKVTGFSAETFNIKDRGYLRKGQMADIVVFDGTGIREHATLEAPFEHSTGVRHVMVNGQFVMFDYDLTGARAGRGLRRG